MMINYLESITEGAITREQASKAWIGTESSYASGRLEMRYTS